MRQWLVFGTNKEGERITAVVTAHASELAIRFMNNLARQGREIVVKTRDNRYQTFDFTDTKWDSATLIPIDVYTQKVIAVG